MTAKSPRVLHPLAWVPSSYFAEGIPYAMVMLVAGTMFKDLGHSDSEITLATASVGIAWSLKPFWASFLDMYRTKKFFVVAMEGLMALLLGGMALALPLPSYFQAMIAMMWLLAFSSATQDICVDGTYITSLDKGGQAAWIGVQGTAWNAGRIFGTAAVVGLAGALKQSGQVPKTAWMYALGASAATMGLLGLYHAYALPTGSTPKRPKDANEVISTFLDTVKAFFQKKSIIGMLAFVFLFRTGEGFLLIEAPLFLQARLEQGGVGLTLWQKSWIDGTVSTVVSILGGLLGGVFIAKFGLKRSLLFLAFCLNVPHFCYVYLSQVVSPAHPLSLTAVTLLVSIEKFGYSFGFMGNMLYMMQQVAPGKYKMTHYAFCTALMNLVLVPTQMASGALADWLGYRTFFLVVMFASVPSIMAAWLAPFPNTPDAVESESDDDPEAGAAAVPE